MLAARCGGSPEAGDSDPGDLIWGRSRSDARQCARNPERGKAQGRIGPRPAIVVQVRRGCGPQTGVKPRSRRHLILDRALFRPSHQDWSQRAIDHPDENQSGRTRGTNDTWARTSRNAVLVMQRVAASLAAALVRRVHPSAGANLRRDLNPMSAALAREGRTTRQGQVACARVGQRYAARRKGVGA